MSLTKKQRQLVWDKSNGICWYCGCELPEKGWHADHLEAVLRVTRLEKVDEKIGIYRSVATGEMIKPHLDTLENRVPACAPCNLYKSANPIEWFRETIANAAAASRKLTSGFRIAERFGLITVTEQPVKFWFELRDTLPEEREG